MKIDCHFHTNLSDGILDNQNAVKKAKDNGLVFAVCTDHDVINGEIVDLLKGEGIGSCEGVEVTCNDSKYKSTLHFTAYTNRFRKNVFEILENTISGRKLKIISHLYHLRDIGFCIDIDEFYDYYKNLFNSTHWVKSPDFSPNSQNVDFSDPER